MLNIDTLTFMSSFCNFAKHSAKEVNFGTAYKLLSNKHCNMVCFATRVGHKRFGLPGSLKNTHILGEKLINKEYDKALLLLSEQQSPESDKAKQYKGLAEDFFNSLDLRILAFYKSSFFSYKWNETLKKLLKDKARSKLSEYEEDGILYLYTNSIQNKINLLKEAIEIPYYKFRQQGDTIQKLPSTRPSLIQNIITCNNIDEDIYNKDKWFCELVFFLPSGCYATVATQQFIFDMIKL